jgi:hypothetical protein
VEGDTRDAAPGQALVREAAEAVAGRLAGRAAPEGAARLYLQCSLLELLRVYPPQPGGETVEPMRLLWGGPAQSEDEAAVGLLFGALMQALGMRDL